MNGACDIIMTGGGHSSEDGVDEVFNFSYVLLFENMSYH